MAPEVNITKIILHFIAIDLILDNSLSNDVIAHELQQEELDVLSLPSIEDLLELTRNDAGFGHLRDFEA